jgi:hypothetical protein
VPAVITPAPPLPAIASDHVLGPGRGGGTAGAGAALGGTIVSSWGCATAPVNRFARSAVADAHQGNRCPGGQNAFKQAKQYRNTGMSVAAPGPGRDDDRPTRRAPPPAARRPRPTKETP